MHYRNGREAKNGDRVVQLNYATGEVQSFGVLHGAVAGEDYCYGQIAVVQPTNEGACLIDCLHADDVAAMLKKKGWINDLKESNKLNPDRTGGNVVRE